MNRFLLVLALPVLMVSVGFAQEEVAVEEVAVVDTANQVPNTNNIVVYYIIGIVAFCVLFYFANSLAKKKQHGQEQTWVANLAQKSPEEQRALLNSVF